MTKTSKKNTAFIEEAREELLPELENALLELGTNPDDTDSINRVFRALHTLKGSGAMFGFDRLSALAHEMEAVFDYVRSGEYLVDNQLVELALSATDHLRLLIDAPENEAESVTKEMELAFQKMAPTSSSHHPSSVSEYIESNEEAPAWRAYHIRFKPRINLFANGTNPLFLLDELHGLGTARVVAHVNMIPLLEDINPEACYTWWDIIIATDKSLNTIKDVFIFVEDECELLSITVIANDLQPGQESIILDELEFLLTEDDDIDSETLKDLFLTLAPSTASTMESQSSASEQKAEKTDLVTNPCSPGRSQETKVISSMRVRAAKLDQLVNLVGELVIAQTRLSRLADEKGDQALTEIAEIMERLSNDLRENTLAIRMLPIGSCFGKFKRVVWDFSAQTRKEVELITEGAATELDKTVIERLDDPLVHLLRNSIDHGIEPPEERKKAGKPRQGKIVFSAEHSGGNVIITISDDGQGIDLNILKNKAIEKGLISTESTPSEKELLNILFEPGFSTVTQVSDISGRGVGMDVVKQNIAALRGKVKVTSEKGKGTIVKMTIPLTLAIIDGLQVRIGREHFIVPLAVVNECLGTNRLDTTQKQEERFINLRNQVVPFLNLRQWFSINGQQPDNEQIIIVSVEKKQVGLVVDEVIGLQQAVIKNLGEVHKNVPGISGATIQGDGSIALIIDVEPMVQKAEGRI